MRITKATNKWFREQNHRLDCKPYMSGAIEARLLIDKSSFPKDSIKVVTKGIYHAGREGRTWVEDSKYGVRFLGSTDILRADLSYLPLIAKRQVEKTPAFLIEDKWTLITRSGTIGRMCYSREDMKGMACSEHVLRVVPDEEKIAPGYLFAFLSSKYGVPQIVSSTYGAIVQHIEPAHIEQLEIPRMGKELELLVHNKIDKASEAKSEFISLVKEASLRAEKLINWEVPKKALKVNTTTSKKIISARRLDVPFFSEKASKVEDAVMKATWKNIGEVVKVVKPGMFKRIMSTEENGGIPFHTGSELFLMDAKPKYYVSRLTSNIEQCLLQPYWVLIQAFGQRGGLLGRVMLTTDSLTNASATDLQIQLKAENEFDAGYIFAYLNSSPGYESLIRLPVGGSIPHINPKDIEQVKVPWPAKEIRRKIGTMALDAWKLRDLSQVHEKEAVKMVEDAIEAAAPKH